MGAVESLQAWGIVRPAEVVEIAAATRLPLPLAAALLEQESGGGHGVWGHDRVETGGAYVPGAEVTRAAYERYRELVQAGKIGRQGVGATQLTSATYQDQADRLGGCWDWRVNVRVGFLGLAALVDKYGLPDGVRRYNGSGPAAEMYRDKMLARYQRWTDRLGADSHVMPVPSNPSGVLMALSDAEQAELLDLVRRLKPGVRLAGRSPALAQTVDDHFGWSMTAAGRADVAALDVAALRREVAELRDAVARINTATGDPAAFAAAVADQIAARLRE